MEKFVSSGVKVSKYFLLVVGLFIASYFHFNLQYKLLGLKQSQDRLAWDKFKKETSSKYDITFMGGNLSTPFLLNRNTGESYAYVPQANGWLRTAFNPIDSQLKELEELKDRHGELGLYLLNSNLFKSVDEFNKFLDDFEKHYRMIKEE